LVKHATLLYISAPFCAASCSSVYDPICVNNGDRKETFNNPCIVKQRQCQGQLDKILHYGECESSKSALVLIEHN